MIRHFLNNTNAFFVILPKTLVRTYLRRRGESSVYFFFPRASSVSFFFVHSNRSLLSAVVGGQCLFFFFQATCMSTVSYFVFFHHYGKIKTQKKSNKNFKKNGKTRTSLVSQSSDDGWTNI